MKHYFLSGLIIGIFLWSGEVFSQPLGLPVNQVVPKSPNTAALGRFGDYQVSLFTGVPSISIPLYTIKTPAFEVPISLNYHASGNKVADFPSWVGLGWALDAGGEVRRRLVGMEDEIAFGFLSGHPAAANTLDIEDDRVYIEDVLNGSRDEGADFFSYSFPGASGKFFYDQDNGYEPVQVPYTPVKVQRLSGNLTFEITDAKGSRYFYENAPELASSSAKPGVFNSTATMLDKMVSAMYKDTVYFSYVSQNDDSPLENSETWVVDDLIEFLELQGDAYTYSASPDTRVYNSFINTVVGQVQSEIRFRNGRVVFEREATGREDFAQTNSKALKEIRVYSVIAGAEVLQRTIRFFHSYFSSSTAKRLKLDSLQVIVPGSVSVETYRFDYNTDITLPEYTSRSRDFWGYYNGRTNSSMVPQKQVWYQPSYGDTTRWMVTVGTTNPVGREPDSVYMQAAILKKIHYPTKGYTEFEYETNRHLDDSNQVKLAGGLRIKTIKNYDGISATPVIKKYKYGYDESGVGRANYFYGEYFLVDEQVYEYWNRYVDPDDPSNIWPPHMENRKRRRSFSSSPSVEVEPVDAAPVVYPFVTEYIGDESSSLGKTTYEFRDSSDALYFTYGYSKPVLMTRFFSRGQLLKKRDFKKVGSSFIPVMEQVNEYNTPAYGTKFRRVGLSVRQKHVKENITDYPLSFTLEDYYYNDYNHVSDDTYLTASSTKYYDQDDTSKTTVSRVYYDYGHFAHQQAIRTRTIDSKSDTLIAEVRFPADYIPAADSLTHNAMLDTLLAKNIQVVPVEQWSRKSVPEGANTVNAGLISLYKKLSSGLVAADTVRQLIIPGPVTDYTAAAVSGASFQMDSRYADGMYFNQYDGYGNILERQKKDEAKEAFLWGYNGQYPIARVLNAPQNEVFFDSFEDQAGWDTWGLSYDTTRVHAGRVAAKINAPGSTEVVDHATKWLNISLSANKKFRYSGWVYSDGPSVEIYFFMKTAAETGYFTHVDAVSTTETGKWVYLEKEYEVPSDITLLNIRIDNNGSGNVWFDDIRLYPADAQMATYTYDPQVGITSQADINNRFTHYEYDAFSRLSLVRDQDSNVVKKICYNYFGQPEDCGAPLFYSVVKSGNFTRNNCGAGYNGGSVTYTVPAGTYSSAVNQAAADALAQADVDANGQTYANTNGTCTLIPVYARLEYQNIFYDLAMTTADLVLKFYSDAACTIPYSVTNLNVNYSGVRTNCGGGSPATFNYTAYNCSGTSVVVATDEILMEYDGLHCWEWVYSTTAGSGYFVP